MDYVLSSDIPRPFR